MLSKVCFTITKLRSYFNIRITFKEKLNWIFSIPQNAEMQKP